MLRFIIDSLVLRDWTNGQTVDTPYILEGIEGIEAPAYRITNYENPGEDGGTVSAAFYGTRPVTLTGRISGRGSSAAHSAARQALESVCRLRRDQYGFPQLVRVSFRTLDGTDYFFSAQVKAFKNPLDRPTVSDFQVQMLVPDPFIYAIAPVTTGQFTRPAGGGVTYPVTYPAVYGSSTGGTGSVNNAGNADTWPLITLRGVLTNPYVYSVTRGKGLKLNYAMGASDIVVIDMNNRSVILNGTTNLLYAKDATSDWFSLATGPNAINLSTGLSSDTGTAEVSAYPAYLGV